MIENILRGVDAENEPITLERRGDLILRTAGSMRNSTLVRISGIHAAWTQRIGRGYDLVINLQASQVTISSLKIEQLEWLVAQIFGEVTPP